MLKVIVFVVCVAYTSIPLYLLTAFLMACSILKHVHRAMVWRYASRMAMVVDYIARIWVTVLTYSTSLSFFYLTQSHQWTTAHVWSVLASGLSWPLLRHGLRFAMSLLLVDPHGTRGTVRVYLSLALDLPVLISINAQNDMDVVWTMMVCLAIVDSAAWLWFKWMQVEGMFALSNLLWMNFISLSFLITLKSPEGLTTFQVTQRVWYAVIYLCLVVVLPTLYARVGTYVREKHKLRMMGLMQHRFIDNEHVSDLPLILDGRGQRDDIMQQRANKCCPVIHAHAVDVKRDRQQDFSDESISASGHVMHLTRVVTQSDAVSFALWGVYQLYLEN